MADQQSSNLPIRVKESISTKQAADPVESEVQKANDKTELDGQIQHGNQAKIEEKVATDSHTNGAFGAGDDDEDEEGERGVVVTDPALLPEPKKKKKKNKARSAGKRGLNKPTGMEEFYADAPLTAAEYAEQKALYDTGLVVHRPGFVADENSRLLTAIQRFERTRKLTPERRDIFYKWLHYGSIKIGPNVGGGGQNLKEMDKGETAIALSQVSVSSELRDALDSIGTSQAKYVVDFMGCVRGFLSRVAPCIYPFDNKEAVEVVTSTIERFLDYLLQHDICPEYAKAILETRNFCREASFELWSCAEAQRWLPGDFNIACSTLLGGKYARDYDGETWWGDESLATGPKFVGLSEEEAKHIFTLGVAGAASEEAYQAYLDISRSDDSEEGLEIIRTIKEQGFEIVHLENPTADCKDMYNANSDKYRPVGKVIAKPWKNPEDPPEDVPVEQTKAARAGGASPDRYEFLIEEILLQHLSIGQKIMATIHQINCGIWFFDDVTKVFPDFDLWLVNELVEDYREARWLLDAYAPGAPGWDDAIVDDEAGSEGGEPTAA
ncbi:hypothetical protein LTS08_002863 [Lithohypha guttulata]|nr:hypothetical protein LTS08_002863 [Lithohypha guttulata]